jgi:hypothetical protein
VRKFQHVFSFLRWGERWSRGDTGPDQVGIYVVISMIKLSIGNLLKSQGPRNICHLLLSFTPLR